MTSPTPYQLLPRLSADEYDALREDIRTHGIRVPIDVDEDGVVLDGHHRSWIAADLDVNCPKRVVTGLSAEGKRAHAVAVNVHRRNLTREQRRELVARLRQDGMSQRAISEAVGVPQSTVDRDLKATDPDGSVQPERITGKDGKSRPARVTQTTRTTEATKVEHDVDMTTGEINPPRKPSAPRIDVTRTITNALVDLDRARRALDTLTTAHLRSQTSEARQLWAAGLTEHLDALHGFETKLTKEF